MSNETLKYAQCVKKIDISGIRKMFEAAGERAINLGLGQPDFDTPEHVKKAAIDAIRRGYTGYTVNKGLHELRGAISRKLQNDNGINTNPDNIIVTSGASEGLHIALIALVESGDEVLIPDPGFVSYGALTILEDAKPVGVPLRDDLTMSPETVNDMVTGKTRAVIINSPANPTGAVQTPEDIKAFAEIADDNNITLISDEVYEKIIYEGEHASPGAYSDNVITINATSKTYSMTGWRLGYLSADSERIEQMLKAHQYVQACASSISQYAALAAITGPQDCVEEMCATFRRRRDIISSGLEELGLEFVMPHGAFYVMPRVPDEKKFVMDMLGKGVVTTPGSAFGVHGAGHVRLSYSASEESIKRALRLMKEVL